MVMRTSNVLIGLGYFAAVFALMTASAALAPQLTSAPAAGAPALLQTGAGQPASRGGAGSRLFPGEEDGGFMAATGACGDTVLAGALSGSMGLLGAADLVAVFLAAVLGLPSMCPCCPGARCGERDPPLTKVPLRLAPAGLIWPPSRRAALRAKLEEETRRMTMDGVVEEVSLDAMLRRLGLDPWEEVQVESWFECEASGAPVDERERLVRDALLAELATAPDSEDPSGPRLAAGWAMTAEARALTEVAREAYAGAMRRRFGASAVAEGSGPPGDVDPRDSRHPRIRQRFLAE